MILGALLGGALHTATTIPRRKKYSNSPSVHMLDVHLSDLLNKKRCSRPGFLVDIGAPLLVVGIKEVRRIVDRERKRMKPLRRSQRQFCFAQTDFESLGVIDLPLATPPGIPTIYVTCDVILPDVPALLGLSALDAHSVTADTVSNRLIKRVFLDGDKRDGPFPVDEWHVPLTRFNGHVCAAFGFPTLTFLTRVQLSKLHRQFRHPSAEKLYNILKRAKPDEIYSDTFKALEDLVKQFDMCQRVSRAPGRFHVAFGAENVCFNDGILMDVMYLDGKPVLRIVDKDTGGQNSSGHVDEVCMVEFLGMLD